MLNGCLKPKKAFEKSLNAFLLVMIILFLPSMLVGASGLRFSKIYSQEWLPGQALGYPGFVYSGKFDNHSCGEFILFNQIPESSDVITLCHFDDELEVIGSLDKDCSSVYHHSIGDFTNDSTQEILLSQDWSSGGSHLGIKHQLYDYSSYTFNQIASLEVESENIFLDLCVVCNIDNDQADECIFGCWDSQNATALVRIYDFVGETFVLLANYSYSDPLELSNRATKEIAFQDVTGDNEREVVMLSLGFDTTSMSLLKTYEVFSYSNITKELEFLYAGTIDVTGSSIHHTIADLDSDQKDELIVYLDKTIFPQISIFDISTSVAILEESYTRPQADYSTTGFYCNELTVENIDADPQLELILSEITTLEEADFPGRFEIFEFLGSRLFSEFTLNLDTRHINSFIGEFDAELGPELITTFTRYYPEQTVTKGGIEIFKIFDTSTESVQVNYLFLIISTIMVASLRATRKKKIQK